MGDPRQSSSFGSGGGPRQSSSFGSGGGQPKSSASLRRLSQNIGEAFGKVQSLGAHAFGKTGSKHSIQDSSQNPVQSMTSVRSLKQQCKMESNREAKLLDNSDAQAIARHMTSQRREEELQIAERNKNWHSLAKHYVRTVVEANSFDLTIGLCVAVNAICMVLEYEYRNASQWRTLDHIFLVVFCVELSLRLFVFGLGYIRDAAGALDFFIVLTGIVSQWIMPLATSGEDSAVDLKTLQVLKVLRVMRCVRVLRMLTIFKDLWIIVQSFFECLTALLWTVVFILIVLFIFGMFGVELIGKNNQFDNVESQEFFRRPVDAMLVLFQLMSLDGWMEIVDPLFQTAAWTYFYFIFFIGIGALALMNLVTAVVVESSVKRVRDDAEFQQQLFQREVAVRTAEIDSFWRDLQVSTSTGGQDSFGTGSSSTSSNYEEANIDLDHFLDKAAKHPFLASQMRTFGMTSLEDFAHLFHLLDVDDSDSLELHEVIRGVLKLQQLAREKDTSALISAAESPEEKRLMLTRAMEGTFDDTSTRLHIVEKMLEKMAGRIDKLMLHHPEVDATASNKFAPAPPPLPDEQVLTTPEQPPAVLPMNNNTVPCERPGSNSGGVQEQIDTLNALGDEKPKPADQPQIDHSQNRTEPVEQDVRAPPGVPLSQSADEVAAARFVAQIQGSLQAREELTRRLIDESHKQCLVEMRAEAQRLEELISQKLCSRCEAQANMNSHDQTPNRNSDDVDEIVRSEMQHPSAVVTTPRP